MVLDKVRDPLDEVPAVPGGPYGQDGDLGVGPTRAMVLHKVKDHLNEVPAVPGGPDSQEGHLGIGPTRTGLGQGQGPFWMKFQLSLGVQMVRMEIWGLA